MNKSRPGGEGSCNDVAKDATPNSLEVVLDGKVPEGRQIGSRGF